MMQKSEKVILALIFGIIGVHAVLGTPPLAHVYAMLDEQDCQSLLSPHEATSITGYEVSVSLKIFDSEYVADRKIICQIELRSENSFYPISNILIIQHGSDDKARETFDVILEQLTSHGVLVQQGTTENRWTFLAWNAAKEDIWQPQNPNLPRTAYEDAMLVSYRGAVSVGISSPADSDKPSALNTEQLLELAKIVQDKIDPKFGSIVFGRPNYPIYDVLSPMMQLSAGVESHAIKCKADLILIHKHDDSPACVKPETKQILIERGWAKSTWTATYVPKEQVPQSILERIYNSDIVPVFGQDSRVFSEDGKMPVLITNSTASQICDVIKMECPKNHAFEASYDLNAQTASFEQTVGLHTYDLTVTNSRICHTLDGRTQVYCTNLSIPLSPMLDGNAPLLLSRTASQWKDVSHDELHRFYEIYGDVFYTELGRLLILDEIKNTLEKQVISYDGIQAVIVGIDQSLPPDVYYESIVRGTDGKTYLSSGGTNSNKIIKFSYAEIENP